MNSSNRIAHGNRYMLCLLLWIFGVKLLYTVLAALQPELIKNIQTNPIELIAVEVICFLPPVLWFVLLKKKGRAYAHLSLRPLSVRNVFYVLGMAICLLPFMMLLSGLSSLFFPNPAQAALLELKSIPLWVQLLAIAVIPAILEELNLRGVVFGYALDNPLSPNELKKAVIVNGLFFGFMHLNLQQFPYALAMGMIFCLFVYWTGSILAGILAHFTLNAFSILLVAYTVSRSPEALAADSTAADLRSFIPLVWLTLVFGCGFIWIYRWFTAYNQTNQKRDPTTIEAVRPLCFFTREFWAVVILFTLICFLSYWP